MGTDENLIFPVFEGKKKQKKTLKNYNTAYVQVNGTHKNPVSAS